MSKLWTLITQLHAIAGPVVTLLYPLYASVVAMESTSKLDDEQWLAYWIIYSFLTLMEIVLQSLWEWIPIWYDVKLLLVAWLVLPQFKGATFLYERFVRQYINERNKSPNGGKAKNKFFDFIASKKGDHGA
ncbi:hypothetical protein Fmac_004079 [Flemingia macrophylla]|uniref:HVA22-like protein n=1 Tax=Flemingia macrophylla TaxID=520843 RepID=A0ABD1N422_9FABA